MINGESKSKADYREAVHRAVRLNPEAPESFVFLQGRLEASPYLKGGTGLTGLLEKVCGSINYREEYEEVSARNETYEGQMFSLSREIRDLRSERRKLESIQGYVAEYDGLIAERDRVERRAEILRVLAIDKEIEDRAARGADAAESLADAHQKKAAAIEQVRKDELEAKKEERALKGVARDVETLRSAANEAHATGRQVATQAKVREVQA